MSFSLWSELQDIQSFLLNDPHLWNRRYHLGNFTFFIFKERRSDLVYKSGRICRTFFLLKFFRLRSSLELEVLVIRRMLFFTQFFRVSSTKIFALHYCSLPQMQSFQQPTSPRLLSMPMSGLLAFCFFEILFYEDCQRVFCWETKPKAR